jgi:hypothetical protein
MIMSFNPTWRTQAIETLVNDDMDTFVSNDFDEYVKDVLKFGFQGYSNMTDEELEQELNGRDISTVFGENDE